jgi:hypothetical protein
MSQTGNQTSIHFPPGRENRASEVPNVLGTFAAALSDAELVREKLRKLLLTDNRHGELQIVLSAARRVEQSVLALIAAEEEK